jgi:hypothetical protein
VSKIKMVKDQIGLCHGYTGSRGASDALIPHPRCPVAVLTTEVRNFSNKEYDGINSNLSNEFCYFVILTSVFNF